MKINTKEYINRLKKLQSRKDEEYEHLEGDRILCELIEELGYKDIVNEWNKIKKYYI